MSEQETNEQPDKDVEVENAGTEESKGLQDIVKSDSDSDGDLGFEIDVNPQSAQEAEEDKKQESESESEDEEELEGAKDPELQGDLGEQEEEQEQYVEEFPQLQISEDSDDEGETSAQYKDFFDIQKLDKIRNILTSTAEKDDSIMKLKATKDVPDDWYDPKDSLLTLLKPDRLRVLRKYVDGTVSPEEDSRVKRVMKDIVTRNLEAQDMLPPLTEKERKSRKKKPDTAGEGWANLPLTQLTDEVKEHFRIVKNRGALHRNKFRGAPKGKAYPKYSVMGTIIANPSERGSDRRKKTTLLQEVIHDRESRQWLKRKYSNIQGERKNPTRPDRKRRMREPYKNRRKRSKRG